MPYVILHKQAIENGSEPFVMGYIGGEGDDREQSIVLFRNADKKTFMIALIIPDEKIGAIACVIQTGTNFKMLGFKS